MFSQMNSKLLAVAVVTLAAASNLLVSAGESCGPNKYRSSSTAQCEDCGSICVDISRRSMECKIKCPEYQPAPIPAEVKGNSPAAAAVPPYLLLSIGGAVTLSIVVLVVVGGLFYWKRRAATRSYTCDYVPTDVEMHEMERFHTPEATDTTAVSPTDGDADTQSTTKLLIGHHEDHPLILNVGDCLAAQNVVDQAAHCTDGRRSNQY